MASQIFKLQNAATRQQVERANQMAAHLEQQGFECKDLDDLVYEIAQNICRGDAPGMGSPLNEQEAEAEYIAAEELNNSSMADQLRLVMAWHKDLEQAHAAVSKQLQIALPV